MPASSPSQELSTEIYVIRAGRPTIYLRFLEICSKRRRAVTCEVANGRGAAYKSIRLTSSEDEVEVREGKSVWVLKTCFLKKA